MKLPPIIADFYIAYERAVSNATGRYLYDLIMPDDAQLRLYTQREAIRLNDDLDVADRLPGFFAIGDNAGDEILCVNVDTGEVVQVPLTPMHASEALHVADSLAQIVLDGVGDCQGSWNVSYAASTTSCTCCV